MTAPAPEAYLEVRVELPKELVDAACDFIIEHIASGIVLEDEEDAVTTGIIFYVPEGRKEYRATLEQFLSRQIPERLTTVPEIRERRVANAEWLDRYRESVRLIRITDDLIVRPSWIPPTSDRYQLILEPKMAFGTGSHATTRSCLKIIRERFQPGGRFLDMGCGSGILSVLADQMGAAYIKAVDYDLAAVANCQENFEINGVQTPHEILVGSIEKCGRDKPYHCVCANIIRTTIITMLDRLLRLTLLDGILVLSGLLEKDESVIADALKSYGQTNLHLHRDEEWLTFTVVKK
jgi:ribosomal protein L11 methyltransferase